MPANTHLPVEDKVARPGDLSAPASASARSLLNFLVEKGLLKPGFRQVLHGRTIAEIRAYILHHRLVEPQPLLELLAEFFGLPFERLVDRPINPSVVKLLPREAIERYKVLPFELKNAVLTLAVTDPALLQRDAPGALVRLRKEKGLHIKLVVVPPGDAEAVVIKAYDQPAAELKPAPLDILPLPPAPPKSLPIAATPAHSELHKTVEGVGKTIDLTGQAIPPATLNQIPYAVAKRYQLIVFDASRHPGPFEPPMIKVAMVEPESLHVKEILAYIENRNKLLIDRYRTTTASFEAALKLYPEAKYYHPARQVEQPPSALPSAAPLAETAGAPPGAATGETVPASATPSPILRSESQPPAAGEQTLVTLTAGDIVNRPTAESVKELARMAEAQQASLEDQDLDKLIKKPVTSTADLAEVFKTGMVPEVVAAVLFLAIRMRASDVHLETEKEYLRIRYRIDGILHDIVKAPSFLHAPLIARIKILSKMKIDESRVPQDGRFDVVLDKRQVDLRVSTLPTIHGEKVVMRLLDKSEGMQTLEQLGLTGSNFDVLIKNIAKPYGIILSTGPTGSGKSTTLYSILTRISRPGVNIITLEDPVEYELPGLNQAQVMPQIGFTFAEGLRSVLRQDPNVIMVGEIRDLETAAMATQAALTGHLVLSTLHTNEASGALPRLIDMGIEPFLITSSLNAVIGQRLVRRICEDCREKVAVPPAVLARAQRELAAVPSGQLKAVDLEQLVFYHGKGCPNCTDGFRGRVGIFEVMAMNEEIENLAVKKAPASELQKAAIKNGMVTMVQDGLMKALKGLTTVDEVMRVTMTSIKEVPGTTE
ncbi:MAG TPA: ATPase, T2SS/T4P/T4SS family [Candidatus Saccharimonadales bacterium]|nr:ATPase, T2SS/T4P/T4SS family [Candidatus Saccharimonadales bacterium]